MDPMLPCVCSVKDHTEMTSKFGKTKQVLYEAQWGVSLMFLPRFEAFCNLVLNRPTNHDRLTPLESYCLNDQSVTRTGLGTFERQQLLTRL